MATVISTATLCEAAGLGVRQFAHIKKKFASVLKPAFRIGKYQLWHESHIALVRDLKTKITPYRRKAR